MGLSLGQLPAGGNAEFSAGKGAAGKSPVAPGAGIRHRITAMSTGTTSATLKKWGNSIGLVLPAGILKATHLTSGSRVEIDIADGALVIRKAKVPVVPAAISGSFEAYPTGSKYPVRKPIRVMYGPPMTLHDRKPDQILGALRAEVQRMFDRLQAMNPHAERDMAWAAERARRGRAEKRLRKGRTRKA